jgi:hypothetical protein
MQKHHLGLEDYTISHLLSDLLLGFITLWLMNPSQHWLTSAPYRWACSWTALLIHRPIKSKPRADNFCNFCACRSQHHRPWALPILYLSCALHPTVLISQRSHSKMSLASNHSSMADSSIRINRSEKIRVRLCFCKSFLVKWMHRFLTMCCPPRPQNDKFCLGSPNAICMKLFKLFPPCSSCVLSKQEVRFPRGGRLIKSFLSATKQYALHDI